MNDIDLTDYLSEDGAGWNDGAGWQPISTSGTPFTGTFDGNGKSISGLIINRSDTNYQGLFGYVCAGAVISNLELVEVDVTGKDHVGGLIGYNNIGTITDCSAGGSINGSGSVGGLIGSSVGGEITDSHSACNVGGNWSNIGGLVGSNSGTVNSSYATGDVGGGTASDNPGSVGGLVGNNSGTVSASYATGDVTGATTRIVGGLVGWNNSNGNVICSYAVGNVSGRYHVGGLVGHNFSTVINSYATGAVNGFTEVGGLVGTIHINGNVTDSYSIGTVHGSFSVGGLVGYSPGKISDSYYNSDITGLTGFGEPKTTFQMQALTTFTGWDFSDIWGINPDENDGYPFLQWQTEYSDAQFAGGTGEAVTPYELATPWQLTNVGFYPYAHFILINDIDLSDFLAEGSAGWNGGAGWQPIGKYDLGDFSKAFTGSFDGNGNVISNLFINRPETGEVGLFGYAKEAVIRNTWFMGVDVTGKDCTGSLVGINNGEVTGSYATGNVKGKTDVGGLVGQNFYNGSIFGCYTDITVNGVGNHTGDLVGSNLGGDITESYAVGNVTGNKMVGGLVGYNDGDITNSYAAGSVAGDGSIGGLVGEKNRGNVTGSYYDSYTTGQSDSGKGDPKTTAEMQQQTTFAGWDFTEPGTWRIFENYTYPVLQWQAFSTQEINAMISIDKDNLEIIYAQGDSAGKVTRDLTLPLAGANDTTISWSSSDTSVIANNGKVTTPSDENKTVILNATISRDEGTEQTKEFTLTVVPKMLESITIIAPPAKRIYTIGDTLDISGMVVTGTYNDNSTAELTITPDHISGFDSSAEATGQVLTVTYAGKSTTFTVDIVTVPITYTVTYNANGGMGTAPTESNKTQGETFTTAAAHSLTAPEGKRFKQWNTKNDGTGIAYMPGAQVTMPAENLTLYAIWEDIPYIPSDNVNLSGLTLSVGTLNPAFNQAVTDYAASVGRSVSGIEVTPTTADSKATVTVNGISVANGSSGFVSLNTGKNKIIIVVTAENITTAKTYIVTVNRASSGSSGGGSRSTPDYNAKVTGGDAQGTEIPIAVNTRLGTAMVSLEKQAEKILGGDKAPTITVPFSAGINTYTLKIPGSYLCGSAGGDIFTFSTPLGCLTIPGNMLTRTGMESPGDICITIGQGSTSGLSDRVKEAIGDRPIVQLALTVEGKHVDWSNPDAPVTIAIPYQPTNQELANAEHITVWYVDGAKNAVAVPKGRYDPVTKTVTFTTTHFSKYAVVYVQQTFDDLANVPWAKKQIEVLASKGILRGTSKKEYAPQINITRADFLYSLIRTLGVDAKLKGNFDDKSKDFYYYQEIGIAKELGITSGTGGQIQS
jgi:hypothetical protein